MAKRVRAGSRPPDGEVLANFQTLLGPPEDWEEEPPETTGLTDLERLQGTWNVVTGRRPAVLLVAGTRFTVRFLDGEVYTGTFDLVLEAYPRVIAMAIEDGPDRHRGKTALCLYDLDGDTLRWCALEPGREERPEDFPDHDDRRYLAMIFRREPAL
jgi:uncharacterized protein (TIGR03067 family)